MDCSSFDIGPYGFLPSQPLQKFENPYYHPWDVLASDFHHLLSGKSFRTVVEQLPCLDTTQLKDVREWQRAYVLLGFFAHGYVWVETPAAEVRTREAMEIYAHTSSGSHPRSRSLFLAFA